MRDRYASLREGLVGAWIPSISGSGLLLPDLSGNGNNGALTNMGPEDWVAGDYGRALDFDGVDDYLNCGNVLNFERTQPFTLCAFIKPRSLSTYQSIFSKMDLADRRGYYFGFETSGEATFILRHLLSGGNSVLVRTTASVVQVSKTTHLCVTFSGNSSASGVAFYANAIKQGNNVIQDNLTATTLTAEPLAIAARPSFPDAFYNGQLDDIRIYNRVLSESEIKLLASRPGIGLRPQRRTMYYAPSTGARRRRILTSMP